MPRILITIPTWNEASIIKRNLALLQEAIVKFLPSQTVLIEVADNASTDGTAEIAAMDSKVSIFRLSEKGKGLAIRRSWERHLDDMDLLVFMDADLAADLSALPALIEPILQNQADVVCGSRFISGAKVERRLGREVVSRVFRILQHNVLHLSVQDAQCGFKAISNRAAREVLPRCQETGWLFDSEFLAISARRGLKIQEIPVKWVEGRDPKRRSALHLFREGGGLLLGLAKIRARIGYL